MKQSVGRAGCFFMQKWRSFMIIKNGRGPPGRKMNTK